MRVHGDLVEAGLEVQSSAPGSFVGRVYINTTENEVKVYKNGQWDTVISGQIPIDLASAPTDGYVLTYNATSGKYEASATGAAGETNTASNVGTGGVGVFKQKSGVDLEFKKINAASSKVTIADDTGNDEVDIDISEASINHDNLLGYVANEHIDHTSVSITGGAGLSGGGDISASRSLAVDINSETADGTPDGASDYVLTYDASALGLKKVLLNNLPGGSGESNTASNVGTAGVGVFKQKSGVDLEFKKLNAGSSKVAITDDTGNNEVDIDVTEGNINHDALTNFVANEHIDHSSVLISSGAGLSGGGDLTTTRTLAVDINSETADATPDGSVDYVLTYDASALGLKKVLLNNLPTSGGGETNTASNVGTAGVGVFKQKNGVDLEFKKINAGSSKVTVTDDTGNDEVDIDVAEASINHDNLLGFVANEHIDHSSVSITGGSGLSGGGDLTASRTLAVDINSETADASPDGSVDYVLTYDASAGGLKKVLLNNLPSGSGDVTGPASSTDNAIARFNGTGGKTIQNSLVTIDDSDNISTPGTLASTDATESTSATTGAIKSSGGISAVKNIVSGGQLSSVRNNAGNSGTSLTVDFNDANVQTITLTGNVTLTLNNPIDGGAYTLILAQDGTGSRTVTWPASVKWSGGTAPTLSTAASSIDVITLLWDGTNYYAASNLDFS